MLQCITHHFAVRRRCGCRLYSAVLHPPYIMCTHTAHRLTIIRFGPFASQVRSGRMLSPVLSVTPSLPIRCDIMTNGLVFSWFHDWLWTFMVASFTSQFLHFSNSSFSVNPEAAMNQVGIFISIVLADQGMNAQFIGHVLLLSHVHSVTRWERQYYSIQKLEC